MSANISTLIKKKVVIVVSSPAVHATLGYPVGYRASELTHAWYELREAGYEVDIASPQGAASRWTATANRATRAATPRTT